MNDKYFESVWDAISDTAAEAENMKLRSMLMMALKEHIAAKGFEATRSRQIVWCDSATHLGPDAWQDRPLRTRHSGQHGCRRRHTCRDEHPQGGVKRLSEWNDLTLRFGQSPERRFASSSTVTRASSGSLSPAND